MYRFERTSIRAPEKLEPPMEYQYEFNKDQRQLKWEILIFVNREKPVTYFCWAVVDIDGHEKVYTPRKISC